MPTRHALVIAVDGLRASALGAYGNTWYATPALDALAAQSIVHDWMWSPSPNQTGLSAVGWDGGLTQLFAETGVATALATDEPSLSDADVVGFTEACRFDAAVDTRAATIADTATARLFALAAQQIQAAVAASQTPPDGMVPQLWWVHSRGFYGPWDAPLSLRESLLEEGDPAAPMFVDPPHEAVLADSDELLAIRAAYAAQTIVLDECVGALLEALDESGLAPHTLVVLLGCRGFALGEHQQVGGCSLYSEVLHVPCLVRIPGAAAPPARSSALVQAGDVAATLLGWFGALPAKTVAYGHDLLNRSDPPSPAAREFVVAVGRDGERAIRTPAWMLRQPPNPRRDDVEVDVELYAKPDDRWEFNEIAVRCPDVAARLAAVLDQWQAGYGPQGCGALDPDLVFPSL